MSRELALESIEAVPDAHRIRTRIAQQLEGVLTRDQQILRSMLVMDGERLTRFTP